MDIRQTPAMVVVSLLSIAFGGSAGPEAPLVQIIGSLGSWLGDRLRLYGQLVRTLTFCGMAAALGAFFGAPLGGALFALEIPHRRGLEYYEALIPALVAAFLSYEVFRVLVPGARRRSTRSAPLPELDALDGGRWAWGWGILGAGLGLGFIALFRVVGRARCTASSGGRSCWPPRAASSSGSWPARSPGASRPPSSSGASTRPATSSWAPASCWPATATPPPGSCCCSPRRRRWPSALTLHTGFRGGFIFPLFFIGAALGLALSLATGGAVPLAGGRALPRWPR